MARGPCKFYAQGNCNKGDQCLFEHIDRGQTAHSGAKGSTPSSKTQFLNLLPNTLAIDIESDMRDLGNIQMDPVLTAYGLGQWPTKNIIAGRDVSVEELRLQYLEVVAANNVAAYDKNAALLKKDMDYCITEVKNNARVAGHYLQNSVNQHQDREFIRKSLEESLKDLGLLVGVGSAGASSNSATANASKPFGGAGVFGSAGASPFSSLNQSNQTSTQSGSAFGSSGFGKSGFESASTGAGAFGARLGAFGAQLSPFGAQSGSFGSQSVAFGQSGAFCSQSGAFGALNLSQAQNGQAPKSFGAFGQAGNTTNETSSGFGSSGFGAAGTKPAITGAGGFGSMGFGDSLNATKCSAYGSTGFGSTDPKPNTTGFSAFGSTSFGAASTANKTSTSAFGNTSGAFGEAASNTLLPFAQVGSTAQELPFGQTTTQSGLAFGASLLVFGQANPFCQTTQSAFGQNTAKSAFGQKPADSPFGITTTLACGLKSQLPFGKAANTQPFGFSIAKDTNKSGLPFEASTSSSPLGAAPATNNAFGASTAASPFRSSEQPKPFGSSSFGTNGLASLLFGSQKSAIGQASSRFGAGQTSQPSALFNSASAKALDEDTETHFQKYDPKVKEYFLASEFKLGSVPEVSPPIALCQQ
ncbi:hypothetical protein METBISCDRAFT_22337 [Metschnikowia bicuspidata]|uniref:C3H1-type domain-containing protein n=1 Tax=Metschnikowia bicuspidata TaxID=27322 RepID=A0A4P9ZF48_9ASCO|nr:hypothetical protein METBISCDRAFT_22337 [Metschnikowia bicuspidata]